MESWDSTQKQQGPVEDEWERPEDYFGLCQSTSRGLHSKEEQECRQTLQIYNCVFLVTGTKFLVYCRNVIKMFSLLIVLLLNHCTSFLHSAFNFDWDALHIIIVIYFFLFWHQSHFNNYFYCRTFLPKGLVGALLNPGGLIPVTQTIFSNTMINAQPVSTAFVPALNALVAIFKVRTPFFRGRDLGQSERDLSEWPEYLTECNNCNSSIPASSVELRGCRLGYSIYDVI